MLFACTGTPVHRFFSSWPQANAAALPFLLCAGAALKLVAEIKVATAYDRCNGTKADGPLHHFLLQSCVYAPSAKFFARSFNLLVGPGSNVAKPPVDACPLWAKSGHCEYGNGTPLI